ncbi:hypothetical protein R6Q59_030407 [Mikania micrantha]
MKMYSKSSSFVANLTLQPQNSCREVSFSCYLNKSEENMIRELANHASEHLKSKQDEEIGVFRAEKYFKGEIEDRGDKKTIGFIDTKDTRSELHQKDEDFKEFDHSFPANLRTDQTNMNIPSVRLSVSCNSRSGLLPLVKQPIRKTENRSKTGTFLARFGCNCINIKSTQIDEKRLIHVKENSKPDQFFNRMPDSDQKTDQVSVRKLDHDLKPDQSSIKMLDSDQKTNQFSFRTNSDDQKTGQVTSKFAEPSPKNNCPSFPVFNSNNPNSNSSSNFKSNSKSGNLAGKVQGDNNNGRLSLGKKLTLLNDWDMDMDIPTEHAKYISSSRRYNNDEDSDSSSDLFEIESFSPTGDSCFSAHRKSDYAPSEVSIDWSVVTASAADFSVVSDYTGVVGTGGGDRRYSDMNGQFRGKKDGQKKRAGILSGCANHKAVRVAGD